MKVTTHNLLLLLYIFLFIAHFILLLQWSPQTFNYLALSKLRSIMLYSGWTRNWENLHFSNLCSRNHNTVFFLHVFMHFIYQSVMYFKEFSTFTMYQSPVCIMGHCIPILPQTTVPVSYTHLDVYKRQLIFYSPPLNYGVHGL